MEKSSHRLIHRITCLLLPLLAISLMVLTLWSHAWHQPCGEAAGARPLLRIGVPAYPGYAWQDENGMILGADAEYAYRIAQYANLNIELVLLNSSTESAFDRLDHGDLDMLLGVSMTPERRTNYLFSEHETGTTLLSINARRDDNRFTYGNIEQLQGLTFGLLRGSSVTSLFQQWCSEHGLTPEILEYSSMEEANQALDAHTIDAGVYGAEAVEGYRVILHFMPTSYYMIFPRNQYGLKKQVDDAMNQILSEDPLYREKLQQKYAEIHESSRANFTKEEKAYIAGHPVVRVAVLQNDEPYYTRTISGLSRGAFPDYYEQLARLTGLQFVYRVYDTQPEAIEAVKKDEADVIAMYSNGLIAAYQSGLRLTNSYAAFNAVLVTHQNTTPDALRTIAVKERSRTLIRQHLSAGIHAELIGCNTANECFERLTDGTVDGVICGLPSANWFINQNSSNIYSLSPVSSLSMENCSALAYDNAVLCSILNKAILASRSSFDNIITKNTLPENNLKSFVSHISPTWIVAFTICMLILTAALIYAIFSLLRRQREKDALNAAKAENDRREAQLAAAERSNEERNQFFSNISHDMRTPLNAILGFSELAGKQADVPPAVRDYLDKIHSSGAILLELINDTLTLSKISSGKLSLHLQPIDSNTLTAPITIPLRGAAEQKNISFILDDHTRRRRIMADTLNAQKILLNLLSNAIKYTPSGGHIRFTIENDPPDAPNPDTVYTIQDDGIGIPADFLPHIYDPFVQENRTGTKTTGTGLGLAIVKQLIELMGGSIQVKSRLNEGTTFIVRLHFEELPPLEPETTEKKKAIRPASLTGKRLLLFEDNELNSEIACALLDAQGLQVTTAENGRTGLEIFKNSTPHSFDAILMDLRMPVMNGYETTRAIRALDREDAQTIPIIAMTADAFADDIQKCIAAGMNAHIAKPIDPAVLFNTLTRFLTDRC